MKNIITKDMINEFNSILKNLDSGLRVDIYSSSDEKNLICTINPANNKYIKSAIFNFADEFYWMLEQFFNDRGIEINYNNTGSIFWAK